MNFIKFIEYSKNIEGQSDEFVILEMMRLFYPKRKDYENCVIEFNAAINKPISFLPWYYKLDLKFKTAAKFIDADTFFSEGDFVSFLNVVLKHRIPFLKIKNVTLQEANIIFAKFKEISYNIKENHPWIFDPPSFGNSPVETLGTIEKQKFTEHYGGYMEIIYLLCKEDLTRADVVINWSLDRFLFQGEYLLRKRIIENLK